MESIIHLLDFFVYWKFKCYPLKFKFFCCFIPWCGHYIYKLGILMDVKWHSEVLYDHQTPFQLLGNILRESWKSYKSSGLKGIVGRTKMRYYLRGFFRKIKFSSVNKSKIGTPQFLKSYFCVHRFFRFSVARHCYSFTARRPLEAISQTTPWAALVFIRTVHLFLNPMFNGRKRGICYRFYCKTNPLASGDQVQIWSFYRSLKPQLSLQPISFPNRSISVVPMKWSPLICVFLLLTVTPVST